MNPYALILYAMELVHVETRITFDPIHCRRSEMRINWQRQTEFIRVPTDAVNTMQSSLSEPHVFRLRKCIQS